jgi:hypothetical protein
MLFLLRQDRGLMAAEAVFGIRVVHNQWTLTRLLS